jgi:hypothetical protein
MYRRLCSKESASFITSRTCVATRGHSYRRSYSTTIPDQRKPALNGLLVEPQTVQQIKEYRSSKEWQIFKARFEKPLLEAYERFLLEAEQNRISEKKQKRKDRRDATLEYRKRYHLATVQAQAEWRESFIKRPW